MNIKELKDLIQEVLQSDISEFELEHTGTKIRLKRGISHQLNSAPAATVQSISMATKHAKPAAAEQEPPFASAEETADNDLHIITSPIVGTVYSSPSPGAEPYVKLGDQVEEGSILCLVEAMKLMNEIPSDVQGEVAHIYIENGHPVEFGQKLFGIRPRKQG
jgi:acetyl-CoA carboxylase biotin carboxyl carrier protein